MVHEFQLKINVPYLRARAIQIIHIFAAITLFISGLLLNVLQAIFYVILRPFSKKWFRKINKYICASMYAQVIFLPEWLSNTELILYVDPEEYETYYGKEHAFCIINHTYEIDWLINWMLCDKIGCLGNFKACSKRDAKWLPTFGWCWIFADFVFLERSFIKDEPVIMKQIPELVNHPEPIWLTFYPEGTRLTPEKHRISRQFSRSNSLPEYVHHMLPRCKGFLACLPLLRGKVGAVYDVELAFQGQLRPSYQQIAQGEKLTAHVYIRRIPLDTVPEGTQEATDFLYDLFHRKDKLKDSFYNTGDFFAESGVERLPAKKLERGYTSLFNFIFWNVALMVPMLSYWVSLLYAREYFIFSIISSIMLAAIWATNKCIEYSSMRSASNYGMETTKSN